MSRGGFKITRCSDQHENPGRSQDSNVPSWMSEFASKAEGIVAESEVATKEAVTVVDRARDRNTPSVYEQMYAIMNGKKPLYSSVDEAVADYQQKTGLTQHLNQIQAENDKSSIESIAKQIVEASEGSEELEKKNSEEGPLIFTIAPAAKDYLDNIVSGNPSLSIPAIIHMVAENFGIDGVSSEHLDDENLSRYISDLLARNAPHYRDESSAMGRDLGLNFESDQNEDAFGGLRPSNSII